MAVSRLGWFGWTPRCLQSMNTPAGFLIALSATTFIHGMVVNGVMNVNISTIERRFRFNSYQSGVISSTYDITFCLLCPVVTYFGSHRSKSKIITVGLLIYAIGCLLSTLPHFIETPYRACSNYTDLCLLGDAVDDNADGRSPSGIYFYVFVSGMVLIGAGSIPIITLGIAFLEDSTTKEKGASYIGIVGAISAVGSGIGFVFGGYLLSFYVNLNESNDKRVALSPSDPTWIGAWWISPIVAAGLTLVAMVCMSSFPKQLPGTQRAVTEEEIHANASSRITKNVNFGKTIRDFPLALNFLLSNPAFLFTTLACSSESFLLNGFAVFLPKLLQNQFHLTTSNAAFLAGSVSVFGAVLGHFSSGYVVRRFSLRTPQILRASILAAFLSALLTPCSFLYCASPHVASFRLPGTVYNPSLEEAMGATSPSASGNATFSTCHDVCDCKSVKYSPVCGSDDLTYFSPCDAGCQMAKENGRDYYGCLCIEANDNTSFGKASKGLCTSGCNLITPYLLLLFTLVFLSFFVLTPSFVVVLRCVAKSQKPFAVGIQWFFIRVIGSIPSPLVIGAIFDATCKVWQRKGDDQGACWLYDNAAFGKLGFIVALICKIASMVCFWLAFRLYRPEVHCDRSSEEDKEDENMLPDAA